MIEQFFALFGRGLPGIADGAARVEILGLPGKRRGPLGRKPAEFLLHRRGRGGKIGDRLQLHVLRIARQHDRGFHRAAMNAVAQFLGGKKSVRRAEARPARGHREHPVLRAQILRDQHHCCSVAAMACDHHELFHAASCNVFAKRHPALERGLGRKRLRARIIGVLGGNADPLNGQERHRQRWRQAVSAAAPDMPRRSSRRFRAADAGRAARSPPAAAPRSSAPHRLRQFRPRQSRSSRGEEQSNS